MSGYSWRAHLPTNITVLFNPPDQWPYISTIALFFVRILWKVRGNMFAGGLGGWMGGMGTTYSCPTYTWKVVVEGCRFPSQTNISWCVVWSRSPFEKYGIGHDAAFFWVYVCTRYLTGEVVRPLSVPFLLRTSGKGVNLTVKLARLEVVELQDSKCQYSCYSSLAKQ